MLFAKVQSIRCLNALTKILVIKTAAVIIRFLGFVFKQNNYHLFSCFPIRSFEIEMYRIAKNIWEKIT